ncbi:hypothetical protein HZB03_01525 [Candidatus Woesearchaeota archaeon]|nr:hypothetical protein [Candidatus Woesearchaeota archaeon]
MSSQEPSRQLGRKAALEMKYLVAIILITVILILLIAIVYTMHKTTERATYKQACKASVSARAKLTKLSSYGNAQLPGGATVGAAADKASIECPTQYITIAEKSDSKIKEKFANLIADCWDNYGAGNLILFSAHDLRFCSICSVVQFKHQGPPLAGLSSYMASNKVPRGIDPNHRTYREFLTGQKATPQELNALASQASPADKIDTTKRYAIVYTFFDESKTHQLIRENPTTAGIVAGAYAATSQPLVFLIPGGPAVVGFLVGSSVKKAASEMQAPVAASQAVATTQAGTGLPYDANVLVFEYSAPALAQIGCGELPVSQLDKRFR